LLREARRARGLSLRAAADELGMSFNTVTRIEHGADCALSNAVAAMRWLDQTAAHHTVPDVDVDVQQLAAGERSEG
jgi:ribosome-binding protein aMBF1 (putative translation factor)